MLFLKSPWSPERACVCVRVQDTRNFKEVYVYFQIQMPWYLFIYYGENSVKPVLRWDTTGSNHARDSWHKLHDAFLAFKVSWHELPQL